MRTKPVRVLSRHSAAPKLRFRARVGEEREAAAIDPTPLGRHARGHRKFASGRSEDDTFDEWDATLTYPSTDVEAGVLDIKIQADSVNTGSGMKNDKLKSKDFFNVKDDPYITFHSNKVVQTGPTTVEVQGTFTIRGVSKPESLSFGITGNTLPNRSKHFSRIGQITKHEFRRN